MLLKHLKFLRAQGSSQKLNLTSTAYFFRCGYADRRTGTHATLGPADAERPGE